jgi:hypothetical protein
MSELLIGVIGIVFLYCLGQILYPEIPHQTIQQELIKMEDENNE